MNAMVFKHCQYPNAAKAFLQFMLEQEQYDPGSTPTPATGRSR